MSELPGLADDLPSHISLLIVIEPIAALPTVPSTREQHSPLIQDVPRGPGVSGSSGSPAYV